MSYSIIHNRAKVETTRMSISRQLDRQSMVIHILEYYLVIKGNKLIYAIT